MNSIRRAVDVRERGLRLAGAVTAWVVGGSIGALALFTIIAAATIPGQSTASASTGASTTTTTTDNPGDYSGSDDGQGRFNRGSGSFFAGSGGQPPTSGGGGPAITVSGGSR